MADDFQTMEEQAPGIGDYLAILGRRKWHLIVPIVLLAPIAIVVALTLPAVYRSTATILIEQQEVPPELIQTTVTSFADQRIQVISKRVMTTANLGEVIDKYGLYQDIRERSSMNAAVAEARKNITVDMINADVVDPRSGSAKKATIAFTLSFEDPSPTVAQKVVNDLVSLFLNENLRQRDAAVEEASLFLKGEADKLAQQIRDLDYALANFKKEHRNNLPEHQSINRELLARTEEQLRDNALARRTLKDQQLYLQTELDKLDPHLTVATASGGQVPLSAEGRLRQLEVDYVGVKARYSATHPDRLQMEREMAALRKDVERSDTRALRQRLTELRGELSAAQERYSAKHPDVERLRRDIGTIERQIGAAEGQGGGGGDDETARTAENPAYVQLQTRLESIKLELKALEEARVGLNEQRGIYEQRLIEGPNIEREYRALTLDYDNAISKYREVKDKQMQAELAQSLETERKGERFVVIEPPVAASEPERPNRPAIMMLGLVGSVGAGIGNLALRELLDTGLRGAAAIQQVTGFPPLAVVPYISTGAERRQRRRRLIIAFVVTILAVLGAMAAVHFFFKPLDLLWFSVLRRLENLLPLLGWSTDFGNLTWNA